LKSPTNIAASVRQRLQNIQHRDGRSFHELLQYYAMERFLYRLSLSEYKEQFILKGALMLRVWGASQVRPTMDIDMLGITSNDAGNINAQFQQIISLVVPDDGLVFDPDSIKTEAITEDADYKGLRVLLICKLGSARANLQVDIGFGDFVYPKPSRMTFPTLLEFPAPDLLGYSRESAIAEKFDAMLTLGMLNSRMKDFYDIWLLSRQFEFRGEILIEAIRGTLENRSTHLTEEVVSFTPDFMQAKQIQWKAFQRRMIGVIMPDSFQEVAEHVRNFLMPVVSALRTYGMPPKQWKALGPWVN